METVEFIGLIISFVIVFYLFYKTYLLFTSNEKICEIITEYYLEKEIEVSNIQRLRLTDRIKYGVPIGIMWFYSYYFWFLTGKIEYVRKVEIEKEDDTYLIKYVELQIRRNELVSIREFDSYEI